MIAFDLVMVVTHQDNKYINKLIGSIEGNLVSVKLLLIVISQCENVELNTQLDIKIIKVEKMGLSKARNIGLDYLFKNKITANHIMFPDDDSSFDNQFFLSFHNVIKEGINYITPIFIQGTKKLYLGTEFDEGKKVSIDDHHLIGSPNQIIVFNLLKSIRFNEVLGVGASFGSCEDYDLFIRINNLGFSYGYTSQLYSFHPAKIEATNNLKLRDILKRYINYSKGFVYIIHQYHLYRFIPLFLVKSIGGCIVSILTLRFKMGLMYFVLFFARVGLLLNIKIYR